MQLGLAKLKLAGMVAFLLVPVLLAISIQTGTRAYCKRVNTQLTSQTAALEQIANMEEALQQAEGALRAGTATRHVEDTDQIGTWLAELAATQHLELQTPSLKKELPSASTPAYTASLHIEAPLPQVILFLHSLQSAPYMTAFDKVRIRVGPLSQPQNYAADINLHVYDIEGLRLKTSL